MNCEQFKLNQPYPKEYDFKKITFGKEGMAMKTLRASNFFEGLKADPDVAGFGIEEFLHPDYSVHEICDFMKHYGFIVQVDDDVEGYEEAVVFYEDAERAMRARFKEALLLELNLIGLPDDFVQRVWDDAYDRGYILGYEKITFVAKEIVYLAQPLIDAYRLK